MKTMIAVALMAAAGFCATQFKLKSGIIVAGEVIAVDDMAAAVVRVSGRIVTIPFDSVAALGIDGEWREPPYHPSLLQGLVDTAASDRVPSRAAPVRRAAPAPQTKDPKGVHPAAGRKGARESNVASVVCGYAIGKTRERYPDICGVMGRKPGLNEAWTRAYEGSNTKLALGLTLAGTALASFAFGYVNLISNVEDCVDKLFETEEEDCGQKPVTPFLMGGLALGLLDLVTWVMPNEDLRTARGMTEAYYSSEEIEE
jgi:hypothetical protein